MYDKSDFIAEFQVLIANIVKQSSTKKALGIGSIALMRTMYSPLYFHDVVRDVDNLDQTLRVEMY